MEDSDSISLLTLAHMDAAMAAFAVGDVGDEFDLDDVAYLLAED